MALKWEGMSVDWVHTGADGEDALAEGSHGLVLLDFGLPDRSGMKFLKFARRSGNSTPVLIITAGDDVDERIAGLDVGADDYIVKLSVLRTTMARCLWMAIVSDALRGTYDETGLGVSVPVDAAREAQIFRPL